MKRKIYHGSREIVSCPRFGVGKKYNDYGLGFYCTDTIDMAKEWGVGFDYDGYANIYEIDTKGLDILNLNSGEYCILHWLSVLLENREFDVTAPLAVEAKDYILQYFKVDYETRDAVVGYRADDSYFSFAQDFLNGTISYRQLASAMHLGKLGEQFVIKSERAFKELEFLGYEKAERNQWYAKKALRDQNARRQYFDVERNRRKKGDLYITQILDEEMRSDDTRLR